MTNPPIVFFDGTCVLCDRTVRLLLHADRLGRLRFAPLQGSTARQLLPSGGGLPDSIVLLNSAGVHVRSDALLGALKELGGPWGMLRLLGIIPRPVRDSAYDWLASRRSRWFGKLDSCRVPSAEEKPRFLP